MSIVLNGWMDQDGTWHRGWTRSRPHYAKMGPSSSPPKRWHSPQFSAHVYCGQTAGWIKMPIGTEAGFDPGDIVLGRNTAPPKRSTAPIFGPCLLWPNGCIYRDTTSYGGRPQPRRHYVRRGPSSPPLKGHSPPP